jgi:hypothetical protein
MSTHLSHGGSTTTDDASSRIKQQPHHRDAARPRHTTRSGRRSCTADSSAYATCTDGTVRSPSPESAHNTSAATRHSAPDTRGPHAERATPHCGRAHPSALHASTRAQRGPRCPHAFDSPTTLGAHAHHTPCSPCNAPETHCFCARCAPDDPPRRVFI